MFVQNVNRLKWEEFILILTSLLSEYHWNKKYNFKIISIS